MPATTREGPHQPARRIRDTEVAQLHREAEPVVVAAPLVDDRQVAFRKGVVPDAFLLRRGEGKQVVALGGRQQAAAGYEHTPRAEYV
jgi:hypothetical protein